MKKLLFAAILAVLFAVFAASPSSGETGGADNSAVTIEVSDANGGNKIDAVEKAVSLVAGGASPESTDYFSVKARRRNIVDGYYTITEASTNMCFNVDIDGTDNDYEGVRLTVWESTEDITQRFRLVMNSDGSYTLFAACSRGGYSRAVGYDRATDSLGLYSPDGPCAATFFIKNSPSGGGMKRIVLSSDETKYLAIPTSPSNSTPAVLCTSDDDGYLYDWKIETWGAGVGDEGEYAMYPAGVLIVTQGPFDIYSHQKQNAIDMQVNEGESITAPFTCKVVAINPDCGNCVWIESTSEVLYADGSYDYMTCMFMHDNDIGDIYVGEIIPQGTPFYEMGNAGYAIGTHCHISCTRGKYSPTLKVDNDGADAVNVWDALFLPRDIVVRFDYGFPWVYVPEAKEQT